MVRALLESPPGDMGIIKVEIRILNGLYPHGLICSLLHYVPIIFKLAQIAVPVEK